MSQRTSLTAVEEILGDATQNPIGNWDGVTSLQPYIDKASALVDRVATCASQKGMDLSSTELEIIERWLAAYNYTVFDPLYKSRSTSGGSGAFVRADGNDYKQAALESDPSGCLNAYLKQQRASGAWLGKVKADQIDAEDRASI